MQTSKLLRSKFQRLEQLSEKLKERDNELKKTIKIKKNFQKPMQKTNFEVIHLEKEPDEVNKELKNLLEERKKLVEEHIQLTQRSTYNDSNLNKDEFINEWEKIDDNITNIDREKTPYKQPFKGDTIDNEINRFEIDKLSNEIGELMINLRDRKHSLSDIVEALNESSCSSVHYNLKH